MFVNEKTNCRIYSFCHPFMTPQRTPLCIPFSGKILFTKREEATLIKILVTHVYHHKNYQIPSKMTRGRIRMLLNFEHKYFIFCNNSCDL